MTAWLSLRNVFSMSEGKEDTLSNFNVERYRCFRLSEVL
jgi:hypothetical protein